MIDLSALGLAATQSPQHSGKNQKGGHGHGQADDATKFDDLIGAAGRKAGQKAGHHAKDDAADDGKATAARKRPAIDLRTIAIDAKAEDAKTESAIDEATARQGRIGLAGDFRKLLKGQADEQDEASAESPDRSADKTAGARKSGAKPAVTGKDAAQGTPDARTHSDPAQELRAMLEPVQKTAEDDGADVKPVRKGKADSDADGADDTKMKSADDVHAAVPKTDATAAALQAVQQHAAAHNASPAQVADADMQEPDAAHLIQAVSTAATARTSDIELSDGKDAADANTAAGDKTDFISVLEARRYLGFSSDATASANAHALTDAIKTDPSLSQLMQDARTGGAERTATEVNTLKLQMSPEHLGNMTASLRLKGEDLSVEVRVETVDAYRQLSQDHDGIVKALKDHGFSIDQVSIQLAPSARADSGQTGGNQSQSGNGQQSLQDGGQGDTARQRGDGAGRNANQNNWTGNERTASFGDTGNGTDDTRSGNLYL